MGDVWAIVVAAGRGDRFAAGADADTPKQFVELGGVRIVDRAVEAARQSCDAVVLVVAPDSTWDGAPVDAVVVGGATRSDSVRAGLAAIPLDADVIVVHDAARPLASTALFASVIAAVREGADAAIPGVRVADTIKRVDGARVVATLARDELVAVQTPQAFAAAALRDAHRVASDGTIPEASDDAALVEARHGVVVVVEGEPTQPEDHHPKRSRRRSRRARSVSIGALAMNQRIGNGYDVHPFAPEGDARALVLAGVEIPGHRGLAGHSDADAIAHAVADALLGPAGLPDLGSMFPASDERYRGASSMKLLADVVARVRGAGWSVGNVNVVVNAEAPNLAAHLPAMVANLGAVLDAFVSITPKRGEGIGAIGRAEGIAVWAVALLEPLD